MINYPTGIALIAALGGFLFGFETAVISGAERTIQSVWSLDAFWLGLAGMFQPNIVGSLGSFTHWIMAAIISWLFPIIVEGIVPWVASIPSCFMQQ